MTHGKMHLKNVGSLSVALLSRVRRLECSFEDQKPHYSSSQFFLLKFHSWHFSLSQLHVVWSCPLDFINCLASIPSVTTWVTATLTLPPDCPSPSQPQAPLTIVQIAAKAQNWSFLSPIKNHFPSGWHSKSLTQSRPFLPQLWHFPPVTLNFLWNDKLSLTLRLPYMLLHCLGHFSSPPHLHNSFFPPGLDLDWTVTATSEHFFDIWSWVRGPFCIFTLHFPHITRTRTSYFSFYFLNCVLLFFPPISFRDLL